LPDGVDMNDRLNPQIGRRDLLRVLSLGAAAASAAPVAAAAAAPQATNSAKPSKARYQANSPEVQTFYRVNRYPAK
jgi:ribosomal protein L12E/L44/L45/RPP1/RPP2